MRRAPAAGMVPVSSHSCPLHLPRWPGSPLQQRCPSDRSSHFPDPAILWRGRNTANLHKPPDALVWCLCHGSCAYDCNKITSQNIQQTQTEAQAQWTPTRHSSPRRPVQGLSRARAPDSPSQPDRNLPTPRLLMWPQHREAVSWAHRISNGRLLGSSKLSITRQKECWTPPGLRRTLHGASAPYSGLMLLKASRTYRALFMWLRSVNIHSITIQLRKL